MATAVPFVPSGPFDSPAHMVTVGIGHTATAEPAFDRDSHMTTADHMATVGIGRTETADTGHMATLETLIVQQLAFDQVEHMTTADISASDLAFDRGNHIVTVAHMATDMENTGPESPAFARMATAGFEFDLAFGRNSHMASIDPASARPAFDHMKIADLASDRGSHMASAEASACFAVEKASAHIAPD